MAFSIDRVIEIQAPADVVWSVISDLPSYGQWNPFCVEVRSTLKPGDFIDMRVRLGARPQWQREVMRDCEPGRGFSYCMQPAPLGALSSLRSHRITAIDAQRCRYQSSFRLQGWLQPLVRMLMGPRLLAGFLAMNQAVKQRAEHVWAERR